MKRLLKNIGQIFLQLLLVIACFYYVLSGINYADLLVRLESIDMLMVVPALAIVFVGYLFLALRLLVLLKQFEAKTFWSTLNASILALGINNIFPLKLGEFAKVLYINKKIETPITKSLGLIIWERFADVNLLALLGMLVMAFYQPAVNLEPFFYAVIFLWVALFVYLKVDFIFKRLTYFLPHFVHGLLVKLHVALTERRTLSNVFLIVAFTFLVWAAYVFQIWFILEKLLLIELTLPQMLTVFVVTALGMAVPSVPGAIGVYEAAMVLSLGWFGVDKTEALMAGIVCHAFIFIPCTLISFIILAKISINLQSFKQMLLKIKYQSVEQ